MADDNTLNESYELVVSSDCTSSSISVTSACVGSLNSVTVSSSDTLGIKHESNQVQPEITEADILQQAFQEASGEFEQITVTYENEQNVLGSNQGQFSRNDELSMIASVTNSSINSDVNVNPQSNVHLQVGSMSRPNFSTNTNAISDISTSNTGDSDKKGTPLNIPASVLSIGNKTVNTVYPELVNQIVAIDGSSGVRFISSNGDILNASNDVHSYGLQSFIVTIPEVSDSFVDNLSLVAPNLSENHSFINQLPVITQGFSESSTTESLSDVSYTTVPVSSIFSTCSVSSRHTNTISETTGIQLPVSSSEVFTILTQSLPENTQSLSGISQGLTQPGGLSVTQKSLSEVAPKQVESFTLSKDVHKVSLPESSAIQQLTGHVALPLQNSTNISNSVSADSQNLTIASVLNGTSNLIVNQGGTLSVPLPVLTNSSNNLSNDVIVVNTSDNVEKILVSSVNTTTSAFRPSVTTKPNVHKLTFTSKTDSNISGTQSLTNNVKVVQGLNQKSLTSLKLKARSAPLGSSENPIQIIQQGNTYHSTQVLTQEQLQQIAHVLQQQHVSKASEGGGSSVLYNPATNTRIVYRVIYPSEFQEKSNQNSKDVSVRGGIKRGRGRPRKIWNIKKTPDAPDDEMESQEISREEKEIKKKHRPRTRSGRISKPPSYMVQDYKRIHHLDFNEDPHDDTDGGYSDFQMSDEDSGNVNHGPKYLSPGANTIRPRNHKCTSCDKAYIGQGGLARHYRQYPSHGSLPDTEENSVYDDEYSNTSAISNSTTPSGQTTSISETMTSEKLDPLSEDKPISSKPEAENLSKESQSLLHTQSSTANPQPVEKPKRRVNIAKIRRRNKLKDVLRHCTDEDLLEIVLPRLVRVISLWEFLLKKFQKEDAGELDIVEMFDQLTALITYVRKLAQDCLKPSLEDICVENSNSSVKIHSEELAQLLGVSVGVYQTKPWKNPHQTETSVEKTNFISDQKCTKDSGDASNNPNIVAVSDSCDSNRDSAISSCSLLPKSSLNNSITVCTSELENTSVSLADCQHANVPVCEQSTRDIFEVVERNVVSPPHKKPRLENPTGLSEEVNVVSGLPFEVLNADCRIIDIADVENSGNKVSTLSETVSLNLEIKSNPSCSGETVTKDRVRDKESCQNLRDVEFGVRNSNKPSHQAKFYSDLTNTLTNDKLTSRAEQVSTISVKNVQPPSMVNQVIPVSKGCFSKEGNDEKKDTASVHLTSSKSRETSVQDLKSGSFLNIPNSNKSVSGSSIFLNSTRCSKESECQKSLQQANTNDNHLKTATYDHQHNETVVNENQHQEVREELIGEGSYQEERQNNNHQQELPSQVYSPNYQQQIGNSGELLSLVSSQDSSSLIRQVMLPDEQTDELNNNEPQVTEIGEHQVLPGNVIIVQNPDGTTTLQIPSDQAIPLETLQALLAMDQNLSEFLGGNLKQQEQQSS